MSQLSSTEIANEAIGLFIEQLGRQGITFYYDDSHEVTQEGINAARAAAVNEVTEGSAVTDAEIDAEPVLPAFMVELDVADIDTIWTMVGSGEMGDMAVRKRLGAGIRQRTYDRLSHTMISRTRAQAEARGLDPTVWWPQKTREALRREGKYAVAPEPVVHPVIGTRYTRKDDASMLEPREEVLLTTSSDVVVCDVSLNDGWVRFEAAFNRRDALVRHGVFELSLARFEALYRYIDPTL